MATILFVVVSFNSPPGLPSVPSDLPEAPSPEEVQTLEELAEWVLGSPISEGVRALQGTDLATAVQQRRRSFELFRRYGASASRQALLVDLPYGDLIHEVADRYRVDGLLLASIIQAESGFDPEAVSPDGALGLMQVLPQTGGGMLTADDLLEPEINLDVGASYFERLLRDFEGDVALALAGYNAGPGSVRRFGGMPPYAETQSYVDRVLSRYIRYQRRLWETTGATHWLF